MFVNCGLYETGIFIEKKITKASILLNHILVHEKTNGGKFKLVYHSTRMVNQY